MNELKKFFKGFFYAGRGIVSSIFRERNMRVHLMFFIYMFSILLLTDWFVLSKGDWIALIVASALVLGSELFNTAVEHSVDLASKGEVSEHARLAKDAAAGAVLVSAIAAVAIGIIVLLQKEAFEKMFLYFSGNIPMFILFCVSVVFAVIFVFAGGKKKPAEGSGDTPEKK